MRIELQSREFDKKEMFKMANDNHVLMKNLPDDTIINEYMIQFTSGSTATVLSLPSSIVWAETPNIKANVIYQISIINNLGIIVKFS